MKTFRPHGIAHLKLDGNVVIITPDGDANRESIEDLMRRLAEVIPTLNGRWGALLRAQSNVLLIPEAEEALRAAVPQLMASGLRGLAVVRLNPEIRHVLEMQYTRIFSTGDIPLRFCDSDEDAQVWLQTRVSAPQ